MAPRKPLHLNSYLKLLTGFLLFSSTSAWSQSLQMTQTDGLVAYSETIDVLGVTKTDLIERAKTWLISTHHTISFISEEMGMISIASQVPFSSDKSPKNVSVDGRVVYIATLLIQDGVFMYEFNNFYHEANPDLPRATDLGFVTVTGTANKDLNKEWKVQIMSSIHKHLNTVMQNNIDSLKKTLLNENLSLSRDVTGK